MLALEKLTIPLLVESPTTNAPVPDPEIKPLKVTVSPVAAAISLLPVLKVMLLVIVLPEALPNKVPPPRVTVPVDKLLLLAPPVATDTVPPLIVVPPV